jgi:hypothetical protein
MNSATAAHTAPCEVNSTGRADGRRPSTGTTDAGAGRLYGRVHVGDPNGVTGSSVRGKAGAAVGIGDRMVDRFPWQSKSALSSTS